VLSVVFEVDFLVAFLLCFFTVVFDAAVEEAEELCAAAGAAAGLVCAAKVKGRLAAVKAIASKVVFMFFLPAGSFFYLPLTIPYCAFTTGIPIACAGYIEGRIRV
jgi:hypothetical protein